MEDLIREGRLALRRLMKRPGTNGVVVITLAVCLGVAAALFSVIESVLLDPWPYRGFDRIVVFRGHQPALGGAERRQWSVAEFNDVSEQRQVFDRVIAGRGRPVNLTGGDRPERVRAAQMSADVFPMLGVEPKLGRAFTPREDRPGAERVVVMSHGLWERRYGAAPDIVGRTLGIEGTDYTVVGVMPDRFRWWNADLWFPLRLDTAAGNRTDRNLTIQARVREGVSLERAEADLNALARRWQAAHGSAIPEYRDFSFRLDYLTRGVLGDVRPALYALLGFVGLVCLIGCVNVANLLMAQAVGRRREVAIHRAMGCGRRRLLGRFLLESLSLALLAGALGLLLAYWVTKLIVGLIPPVYIPAETEIDLDRWTMMFAFASSTVAAVVFGLMPALYAAGVSQTELVREGGTRTTGGKKAGRIRSTLVVAQVALATVLLIASGLMVRTMVELVGVDPGFNPNNVLAFSLDLPEERYGDARQVVRFYDRLSDRIGALPAVESVGRSTSLPLRGGSPTRRLTIEGRSAADLGAIPASRARTVSPGYFDVLEIPVRRGRGFGRQDSAESGPVAIVNRAMARRFWGDDNPVGRRFKLGQADAANPWLTVVGVAGNVREESLETEHRSLFYMPHSQRPERVRDLSVVVRTGVPPGEMVEPVRRAVAAIDPLQPIHGVTTMERIWRDSLGAKPLALALLTVFAVIALLLAVVGIFAVMAFAVSRRTGEIGIRMALGARRGQVAGAFLRQGMVLTLLGVALGLLAGLVGARAIARFIYGVTTMDPLTFVLVALLFALTGALGSYVPARRAARIQPTEALRHE